MKQTRVTYERSKSLFFGRQERSIQVDAVLDRFEMSSLIDAYLSDLLPFCGVQLSGSPALMANRKGWGPGTHPWKQNTFHLPTLLSFQAEVVGDTESTEPSQVRAELQTDLKSWEGSSLEYHAQGSRSGLLRSDIPFGYLGRVPCLDPLEFSGGFEILALSRWSNLVGAAPSPALSFAIGADRSRVQVEIRIDKGVNAELLAGLTEKLSTLFGERIAEPI